MTIASAAEQWEKHCCKLIFEGLRKKVSRCEGVQRGARGRDNTVFAVSNVMLIIIKRSY